MSRLEVFLWKCALVGGEYAVLVTEAIVAAVAVCVFAKWALKAFS